MCKAILCRELTVTIISARNVEDVRKYHKTKLFATATVGNLSANTNTDENRETNPLWINSFKFAIPVDYIQSTYSGHNLEIEICLDSFLRDNQRVGYAEQNIHKLFVDGLYNMHKGLMTRLTLPLVTDSGFLKGGVTLEYIFGEQNYFRKLCFPKKAVNIGTSAAVSMMIASTIGVHIPTPISVFEASDIVKFGDSSTHNAVAVAELFLQCGQSFMG